MYFIYFPGNPNPLPGMGDDDRRAARYFIQRSALRIVDAGQQYRRILDEYRPEDVSILMLLLLVIYD